MLAFDDPSPAEIDPDEELLPDGTPLRARVAKMQDGLRRAFGSQIEIRP